MISEHHFRTARTARYQMIGTPGSDIKTVLYALHGYGHLTPYFARKFEVLENPQTLIVVPEGLHRFYLDKEHKRVGASWMTREDRQTDISDQVEYLDGLHELINAQCPDAKTTAVLGFSQGTATASRWVAKSKHEFQELVLWSGALPPDLSEGELDKLRSLSLHFAMGRQDEFYSQELVDQHRAYLAGLELDYAFTSFDGKHEIPAKVLKELWSSLG